MRIYLACTVRGDRGGVRAGRAICERLQQQGHQVLTTHLLAADVDAAEARLREEEVFRRDIDWLSRCEVLVAKASGSSYGVDFEVGFVLRLQKDADGATHLISIVSGNCAYQPNQNARWAGTRGSRVFESRSRTRPDSVTRHASPLASSTTAPACCSGNGAPAWYTRFAPVLLVITTKRPLAALKVKTGCLRRNCVSSATATRRLWSVSPPSRMTSTSALFRSRVSVFETWNISRS